MFCLWKINIPKQAGGDGEGAERSTAFLCFLKYANTETEGTRNSERENSYFLSLPYLGYLTYVISCNRLDISIFRFTSEDPEAQRGHQGVSEPILGTAGRDTQVGLL